MIVNGLLSSNAHLFNTVQGGIPLLPAMPSCLSIVIRFYPNQGAVVLSLSLVYRNVRLLLM